MPRDAVNHYIMNKVPSLNGVKKKHLTPSVFLGRSLIFIIWVIPSKNERYSNGGKFTFLMGVFVKM